jgi:hypothetical protein
VKDFFPQQRHIRLYAQKFDERYLDGFGQCNFSARISRLNSSQDVYTEYRRSRDSSVLHSDIEVFCLDIIWYLSLSMALTDLCGKHKVVSNSTLTTTVADLATRVCEY